MAEPVLHHVACGALVRAGRVLLVHRSPAKSWYPNVWDFPGGHVEPGETSREALARELSEELEVQISPTAAAVLTIRRDTLVQDIWRVDDWSGVIANAAPDEHDAMGWFSLDDTTSLDLADPEYPALIKLLLSGSAP